MLQVVRAIVPKIILDDVFTVSTALFSPFQKTQNLVISAGAGCLDLLRCLGEGIL